MIGTSRWLPPLAQLAYLRGRIAEGSVKRVNAFSPAGDALVEMLRSLRARLEASSQGIDETGYRRLLRLWEGFMCISWDALSVVRDLVGLRDQRGNLQGRVQPDNYFSLAVPGTGHQGIFIVLKSMIRVP